MKRLIALLVLASASTFAQTNLGLRVSDTGVLLRPTNFWNANAADILAGIGGSSSGIAEAPSDGVGYVRRNASWIQSAWSYLTGTPTTLMGYGITDAQPLDADLTDLADGSLTGSKVGSGIAAGNITTGTIGTARLGSGTADGTTFLRGDNTWAVPSGGGGGSGSVTSVGLSAPSWLTVGGSPVTTSGTLALTATAQTSNTFLAGPVSGAASALVVRAIHANDLWAITNLTVDSLTTTTLGATTLNQVTNRSSVAVITNSLTVGTTTVSDLNALQPADADLTDLADGSLSGSKVGSGIDAGNITSGTLGTARLGSGTANSTTFLRGDNTWATPSGGGGSGDVVGPSSATDNALVRYDSTTGKLVQNSSATVDDSGTLSVSNLTVNGTGEGAITISDATGTNGWTLASPSAVTSTPRLTLPAAASNGIMIVTNSGTNMVAQFVAHPGANGKVMITTNTPAQGFFFGDLSSSGNSTDVQVITNIVGTNTWTKPVGAKAVMVYALGGGGGGGSGMRGAAGTARVGGGGGAGGGYSSWTFDATEIPSTVNVIVGAGGAGGAAQTTNTTAGLNGAIGTASKFGTNLFASGGGGGVGGSVGSGGTAGQIQTGYESSGSNGGAANTSGTTGGDASGISSRGGTGGGAGGGITSGDSASAGGWGGAGNAWRNGGANFTGGSGASANNNGGNGNSLGTISNGTGGGGGGGSISGAGGTGGNGGRFGAGGGGGGASLNGNNSGAGGNGADGYVIVITLM